METTMKTLNFETTEEEIGKVEDYCDEIDCKIDIPDEGDIKEPIGEPTKDNTLSNKIGEPAKDNEIDERVDVGKPNEVDVGKPNEDSEKEGSSGNDVGTFEAIGYPSKEQCAITRQNKGKIHGKRKDPKKKRIDPSKPTLHGTEEKSKNRHKKLQEQGKWNKHNNGGCDGGGAERPTSKKRRHTLTFLSGTEEKSKDEKIQKKNVHLNSFRSEGGGISCLKGTEEKYKKHKKHPERDTRNKHNNGGCDGGGAERPTSKKRRHTWTFLSGTEYKSKGEKIPKQNVHLNSFRSEGGGISCHKGTEDKSKDEKIPKKNVPLKSIGSEGGGILWLKGTKEKSKDEKIPKKNIHLNSIGSEGGGIPWLKANLYGVVLIWTLINPSAGVHIPDSSTNRCWKFETEDPKISFRESNITIRREAEDICSMQYDQYSCKEGSHCFLINKQIVMFCHFDKNAGNFIMIDKQRRTTIYPSDPEDLELAAVDYLQKIYHRSTAKPSTTPDRHSPPQHHQNPESRKYIGNCAIGVIGVIIIVSLLVVGCCKRCCRDRNTANHQRNDNDAKKEEEPALNEDATLINNTKDNDSVQITI